MVLNYGKNPLEVLGAYREIKRFLKQHGFSHRQRTSEML